MWNSIFVTWWSRGLGYSLCKQFLSIWKNVFSCSRWTSDLLKDENFNLLNIDLWHDNIDLLLNYIDSYKKDLSVIILNAAVIWVHEIDGQNYSDNYIRNVNVESNKKILNSTLSFLDNNNWIVVFITTDLNILDSKDSKFDLYLKTKAIFQKYIFDISKNYPNIKFLVFNPWIIYTDIQLNILKNWDEYLKNKFFENVKKWNVRTSQIVSDILVKLINKILYSNNKKNLYYINISKEYDKNDDSYLNLI